jgi:hypothetical protein
MGPLGLVLCLLMVPVVTRAQPPVNIGSVCI